MKLSGIVIAKDEEKKIAECLHSLSFCDEVIVIDSGSKDNTKKVAEALKAKVYLHKSDDFSDLRNYGLGKATGTWVLYIDADERVTPALRENIQFSCEAGSGSAGQIAEPIVAFRIKRKNFYFGKYEWPYIERLERLFKKEALIEWHGSLHESPKVKGQTGELNGFLLHYTHSNLTSMTEKTNKWSDVEAKTRYESHHPKMTWWRFPRVMLTAFWNSYVIQGGWKIGTPGLIESVFQAYSMFITYAKLWELQHEEKRKA